MTYRTPNEAPGMNPLRSVLILAAFMAHEWLTVYGLYCLVFK